MGRMNSLAQHVHPAAEVDPKACFKALRDLPVPILSDNLDRLVGCIGLRSLGASAKLVGTALTVKTRPGDNLMIYKALMLMKPGHVLVVDGGGDLANALIGDLIMQYAMQRGCAGFVVDGAIRDSAAFAHAGMPCHARGISHRGPYKNGPGQINVPVSIAGQVIAPGDYVVGDDDGVVNFAPSAALALIAAANKGLAREQAISQEIANGKLEQSWLQAVLHPHGLA
jgi:RraA family protein